MTELNRFPYLNQRFFAFVAYKSASPSKALLFPIAVMFDLHREVSLELDTKDQNLKLSKEPLNQIAVHKVTVS